MADFLDVNVWVALSVSEHPHHAEAMRYWAQDASGNMAFCRTTALGLLRICCQVNAIGGSPLDTADAWSIYQRWLAHPGVKLATEPSGIDDCLAQWLSQGVHVHRTWTDAYLAAFAKSGSLRLVTFDKDFERFTGLDLLLLDS